MGPRPALMQGGDCRRFDQFAGNAAAAATLPRSGGRTFHQHLHEAGDEADQHRTVRGAIVTAETIVDNPAAPSTENEPA